MNSLSNTEKRLYNDWLIASRVAKNGAFKLRQDFSKITDEQYASIKKLGLFFQRNQSIKPSEFFMAPYKLYGPDNYYDLQYFLTRQAIKCYTLHIKKKETENPDSPEMIQNCKEICSFLYKYCSDRNITLSEYKKMVEGVTPMTLQHLKAHKINFYIIHGLDCEIYLKDLENELLDFLIPEFNIILRETRINFQKSTRLKEVIRKSLSIVDNQLLRKQQNQ